MEWHRWESELTCDEVWYRLNVLLRNLAVCGAKRYEVRGELTDWGCYLWLRGPEGHGGTMVPLRLWTEERDAPGCVIAARFWFADREWWGLPLGAGVLCLEIFFAELVSGVPLSRALMTGLLAGCIAAAVLYGLFFGLARLFSRRRERELLEWIRKYLLLRKPEGVLLPDAETQRAEWIERESTARRRFAFHCALPPGEVPAALEVWIAQQQSPEAGVRVRWSAQWRGEELKLSRTEIREGQREAGSLRIFAGWFKSWQFAAPFRGVLEPDGRGGSILRGSFRRQAALNNPGSREILKFLRTYFQEV